MALAPVARVREGRVLWVANNPLFGQHLAGPLRGLKALHVLSAWTMSRRLACANLLCPGFSAGNLGHEHATDSRHSAYRPILDSTRRIKYGASEPPGPGITIGIYCAVAPDHGHLPSWPGYRPVRRERSIATMRVVRGRPIWRSKDKPD